MGLKITKVKATIINIPRNVTLTTSYGSRNDATTVVTEIFTNDGLIGIGQTAVDAPFYGEPAGAIKLNIETHLNDAIKGESPLDIERLNKKMKEALPEHLSARAGVEIGRASCRERVYVLV